MQLSSIDGDVKKISDLINKEETRGLLRNFLATAICDAMTYTEHVRSITAIDVVYDHKCKAGPSMGMDVRDILRVFMGWWLLGC